MDESPILLQIAIHCDIRTLYNLMLINKKSHRVVQSILRSAPTTFLILYESTDYRRSYQPEKFIFDSLKELYIYLYRIKNNLYYYSFHPDGKCRDCLIQKENICECEDYTFVGIGMIKYISSNKFKYEDVKKPWGQCMNTRIDPVINKEKGFRILQNIFLDSRSEYCMDGYQKFLAPVSDCL